MFILPPEHLFSRQGTETGIGEAGLPHKSHTHTHTHTHQKLETIKAHYFFLNYTQIKYWNVNKYSLTWEKLFSPLFFNILSISQLSQEPVLFCFGPVFTLMPMSSWFLSSLSLTNHNLLKMSLSKFLESTNILCYRQKGLKVADGIKVACQLTLRQEDYFGLFEWALSNYAP